MEVAMEVGTLKELNVKPGDVVECVSEAGCFTVGDEYICHEEGRIKDDQGDEWPLEHSGTYPYANFRIVSRANPAIDLTAITTPFGLLDAATQDALRAHGGPWEFYDGYNWKDTSCISGHHCAYRVKPAPKRETVTVDAAIMENGLVVVREYDGITDTPVRVTFDRVDGKIDLSTYKVEPRA